MNPRSLVSVVVKARIHRGLLKRRGLKVVGSLALLVSLMTGLAGRTAASTPTASTPIVSYTYDAAGQLSTVTDTAGETATYHYDAEGNVLSITHASGSSDGSRSRAPAAPRPVINAVRPYKVSAGGTITVEGTGFSRDPSADVVRVGSLFAPVTEASASRLLVKAPPDAGGTVTVQTPGGSATGHKVAVAQSTPPHSSAPGVNRHPLIAPPGITAVSGLVERPDGQPLAGVRLTVTSPAGGAAQAHTVSNAEGRFLLERLGAGRHQLVIDGDHVPGSSSYGLYAEPVELPAGRTTVLPWITYLNPIDVSDSVTIGSPTTREVTLTNPRLPGLKIEIPPGTVIHDYYGRVVHLVSLTPLAVGRTPFPWAPDMVPQYFSLQPGDATVSGPGLRVIYPNDSNQPPGSSVPYLVDSPNWAGTGWWRYGTGHVSANGREVIPDPGTVYRKILPGGFGTGDNGCLLLCGAPGGPGGGEPVSLDSGLYTYQQTDLTLPDVESVTLSRTYRQLDDDIYDFGVGMSDSLNLYIDANSSGNFELFLPDGSYITYAPTGTTGLYDAVGTPTDYVRSTLTMGSGDPDGPFTVALKDGTTMAFGNPAFLTKVTDRFGNSVTINRREYTYVTNGGGEIQSVTTSDGRWMEFTYGVCVPGTTPSYCVTEVEDNSGRTVSYSYDSNGRLTKVTDPSGGNTAYSWAACTSDITCTELLTVTDPDGHTVVTNSYDPTSGRLISQSLGGGRTWSYSFETNSQNQVTDTNWTNPQGTKYSMTFDADGYAASQTDAVGASSAQTTDTVYDPTTNLLTSETDALGRTTAYSYDSMGNVASLTLLAGTSHAATYTYTYDPTYNRLTSVTDPLGHTTSIAYNDKARTETVTDPMHHSTTIQLNDEGQPVSVTDPLGNTTYLSYLQGDLVAVADPLGRVTSTYFDSLGRPLSVTDPEGNVTDYTWTPLNEQASQTDPLGDATSYAYDPDGDLTSVTDANGDSTTLSYDVLGDLVKEVDPLGNTDSYTYDDIGDVVSSKDGDGNVTDYTYGPLDLLTKVRYGVSGSSSESSITYSYDAANRLIKAVDSAAGTYRFTFDGLDDVLTASSPEGTVSYTYNNDGFGTSMSVPGQTKVTYSYDADNLPTKITQGTTKVTIGYDADSRQTSLTLPDGVIQSTTYDGDSEPSALDYTDGSSQVGNLDYSYNADSLIASVSGSLAAVNLPPEVTSAVYNADNELSDLDGTSYTYDNDGNLLSNGTDTYSWNARGELASVGGGTTAAYTYDPFGRQAQSTVNDTATSYLYNGNDVVQELSGTTPVANFLTSTAGQDLQMTTSSGTTSSYITDALGSTLGLADSSGQMTTTYAYDPSGAATVSGTASANPFEFAGAENDGAGLYSMGARDYNPATGTFLSQDPAGTDSGTTDLYSYTGDDPVNFVDPSGLAAVRHPRRPAPRAHGEGSQPTPTFDLVMSAGPSGGGGGAPATPPQGNAPSPQSGSGGNGGGGGCLNFTISLGISFQYSACTEVLPNGQTYQTTTEGVGVGTPEISGSVSENQTWNVTDPQQLSGGGVTCGVSAGEGVQAGASYSQSAGVSETSESAGAGVGFPVGGSCALTDTQVTNGGP